jgi:hypothetical protein
MTADLPIRYRGYWDVPRIFLTRYRGHLYLFDCPFSETLDDYPDVYAVYLMPEIPDDETPTDWTTLPPRATAYLGEVPVKAVRFDPTRRQTIGAEVFDLLPLASRPANGVHTHPAAPTGATRPAG